MSDLDLGHVLSENQDQLVKFLKENLRIKVSRKGACYGSGGPQDGDDYKGEVHVQLLLGDEKICEGSES